MKKTTGEIVSGILKGVVLIGAKAMMMKAKSALSKTFNPSIFE